MANKAEIKKLFRARDSLKQRLTSLISFYEDMQSQADESNGKLSIDNIDLIQTRLDESVNLLNKFNDQQDQIEISCEEKDLTLEYSEREQFEATCFSTISKLKRLIKNCETILEPIPTQIVHSLDNVKLPIINLPKFNGAYTDWLEFKEIFESLIHLNLSIVPIQKFHYLRASLTGCAAKAVQKFSLSGENYNAAWEVLCSRYSNSDLLIYSHIKAIFELPNTTIGDPQNFRNLSDEVSRHTKYLAKLGDFEAQRDAILIYIITNKFDKLSAKDWEEFVNKNEGTSLSNLETFLNNKADVLEKLEQRNGKSQIQKPLQKPEKRHGFVSTNLTCPICKSNHAIYRCSEFLKLTPHQRHEKIKPLNLCNNCLRTGHLSATCTSGSCRVCKKPHNTLLHFEPANTQALMSNQIISNNSQVLLSTICFVAIDSQGIEHTGRALLDSGSQSNFMTYKFAKRLGLCKQNTNIAVSGISNLSSNIQHKCQVTIRSNESNFSTDIACLLLPVISDNMPSQVLDLSLIQMPNIQLADPAFLTPRPIDLLIGAGLFWDILREGKISLGKGNPFLQNTEFGWVVSGVFSTPTQSITQCNFSKFNTTIDEQLQKFWEIEDCQGNHINLTTHEQQCEDYFVKTCSRMANGRFSVGIPFKTDTNKLGSSKQTALKRFHNLESKFRSNNILKQQYCQFMEEYEKLGHMKKLSHPIDDELCYYLPHHAVLKSASLTTKCRVVFDGSAVTDAGNSLNSIQYVGPTVQQDLLSILLRFRQHAYVFTADITKMYRQINILPEQTKFQRIFWRSDRESELNIYELTTVTYGTASAPYLATRCLIQLGIDNADNYPQASKIIKRDFYVDDLISGSNSAEEASLFCKQITDILATGCFELHKWCSNDPNILKHVSHTNQLSQYINIGEASETKLLGLQWSYNKDLLTYHINNITMTNKLSKRVLLSEIARIFDPLGLLAPAIMVTKIMLQTLWTLKIDWDAEIPQELKLAWQKLRSQLTCLNSLSIPRHVFNNSTIISELHGFCDASQNAYGACVYVRCIDTQNNIQVRLFCAKGKIAPLKVLSIPRLELCGAVILAKLMNKVRTSIIGKISSFYWTDSQVVLCWLKNQSRLFQVFVSNRIAEIQTVTDIHDWNHVGTSDNPADLISRGIQPIDLVDSNLWWEGPSWLSQPKEYWPHSNLTIHTDNLPEMKPQVKTFLTTDKSEFLCDKFSNLIKLKRITTLCIRFIHNCKVPYKKRRFGSLSVTEIRQAFYSLIKLSQLTAFHEEITLLQSKKELPKKNNLRALAPFLDNQGILRVGGRLKNATLSVDQKHPILLKANQQLSKLIFNYEHIKLYHPGPQLLLYTVRQTFWVLGGRNLARKTTHGCITCFKANPKGLTPLMGNLPSQRIQSTYPFLATGTDFAGPFFVREKRGRGKRQFKCYVCLFVCMATRAVHLEVVTDLTTNSFLTLLRRFIARRGQPVDIYSDNGKTYVGAHSSLCDLGKFLQANADCLTEQVASNGITWHFIPAYSPNFGGLWEAGVKSTKHHLKRVLANASVTLEEFITIITDIEGILNSRPISPMSSDPNDFSPLSPGHFLIGRPITAILEPNITNINPNRLSSFQQLEQVKQNFWARWYKEYVAELQLRRKWKTNINNIKENTLVLIKDDNLPPLRWKLGRIVQVHPGNDGIVRVVTIRTSTGVVKRASSRVCPLPLESDN